MKDTERYMKLTHLARLNIEKEWGPAFKLLGERIQSALMAEAVLDIAAAQDEDVTAERVRDIVNMGHAWAVTVGHNDY